MPIYADLYACIIIIIFYICIYATVAKKEVGGLQRIHGFTRQDLDEKYSPSLGKHMVIASAKTRLESTTSHAEVRDKRPEGIGKYGLFLNSMTKAPSWHDF